MQRLIDLGMDQSWLNAGGKQLLGNIQNRPTSPAEDFLKQQLQGSGMSPAAPKLRSMMSDPYQSEANPYLQSVMGGDYLNSNPYLDAVIGDVAGDIQGQVGSMFSGAGRYGSGMNQDVLANRVGDMSSRIRMQNYDAERGRQQQAAGIAFQRILPRAGA